MHAWVLEKRTARSAISWPIAVPSTRQPARLWERMVELHVARHAGDPAAGLAALQLCRQPRGRPPPLDRRSRGTRIDRIHPRTNPKPIPTTPERPTHPTSPRSGVRYHKVRDHAKGGLGVVFVALDEELNRDVALKEIQDRHADNPTSRARFLIEAEITGGLEHPGIVPVYGLGSYDDGRPFYAMRFIKGDSLKDAIAAFHADEALKKDPGERALALQKLLRRFLDVCNAVAYAHSRGVLHRDLKPDNVMVGRYGETLVVDWGLAKSVERPDGQWPLSLLSGPAALSRRCRAFPSALPLT